MTDLTDPKALLKRHLQHAREALVWKLAGLTERAARLPRTATGTTLLGLVKHAANVEIGYFGDTFGRPWPHGGEVTLAQAQVDPQADFVVTAAETMADVVTFYQRVWEFADATIDELPLDAPGRVPWWGAGGEVTLHRVLLHVVVELARHAGHADILREQLDGSAGVSETDSNLPEVDWPDYVARLRAIADQF